MFSVPFERIRIPMDDSRSSDHITNNRSFRSEIQQRSGAEMPSPMAPSIHYHPTLPLVAKWLVLLNI